MLVVAGVARGSALTISTSTSTGTLIGKALVISYSAISRAVSISSTGALIHRLWWIAIIICDFKETGIHPSSLRQWESHRLMVPDRVMFGETSVRVYSEEEVELLKRAKVLMDDGYKLRWAFEKAREDLPAQ